VDKIHGMKLIFSLSLIILSFACSAQQQLWLTDPSQYGKPLEASTGTRVNGDPYLFDNWKNGLAILRNKEKYKIQKLRYNIMNEQVEYDNNGRVFFLPADLFSSFVLIAGRDSVVFQNGLIGIKEIKIKSYGQVVFQGKNKWICHHYANLIDDPDAPYGSAKQKLIQKDKSFYLLKPNEQSLRLKLNKKFFLKTFGQLKPEEFEKFLTENRLGFESENHLKTIFRWLDTRIE
jgi:hypothetical protein